MVTVSWSAWVLIIVAAGGLAWTFSLLRRRFGRTRLIAGVALSVWVAGILVATFVGLWDADRFTFAIIGSGVILAGGLLGLMEFHELDAVERVMRREDP